MQLCVEYCTVCDPSDVLGCQKWCGAELIDATSECLEKLAIFYKCTVDKWPCGALSNPCLGLEGDARVCRLAHGCVRTSYHMCEPRDDADAGIPTCECAKTCYNHDYEIKCERTAVNNDGWIWGGACECVVDGTSVGSCEQLDMACDVWTSCCRKYFDL
jgi:hypothetical protein